MRERQNYAPISFCFGLVVSLSVFLPSFALTNPPPKESKDDLKAIREKLVGTWESKPKISMKEAAKGTDEELPKGMEILISGESISTYGRDNKYQIRFDTYMTVIAPDVKWSLHFMQKDSGTWKLTSKNRLVLTTTTGSVTPLDKKTREIFKDQPEMAKNLVPQKGHSVTIKIDSISEKKLITSTNELKYKDTAYKK